MDFGKKNYFIKKKELPLKTVYYLSFLFFIVIPILAVLNIALITLNRKFKQQALENVRQAQETISAELKSDIDVMSMRLSHLIYTNNNEILSYAAGTDTADGNRRYEYEQRLQQAGNLALEPVKDIVSVGFYMKDGKETYIKNNIRRADADIKKMDWYRRALQNANEVCLGSYDTASVNDLYMGGKKDTLILVFALAPDVTTDRSQKIEMVAFYQSTGAADRIREYNRNYLNGKNRLGVTFIKDQDGNPVFSTLLEDPEYFGSGDYTCVRTPLELNDTVWYLESYIKTKDLTLEYWHTALIVLIAAVLILALAGYYSRYFLRSIVEPVEEISSGLRLVEEGHLHVRLAPSGQYEIRNMIHQFNAMVRRLRALIEEYEERMHSTEKKPADYLAALMRHEMTPMEVRQASAEFFAERYTLLGFWVESPDCGEGENDLASRLETCFERNPMYASRCTAYIEKPHFFAAFYRIVEEDYVSRVTGMIRELQKTAAKELDISLWACIGREAFGPEAFVELAAEIRNKMCLRHLYGKNAVVNLSEQQERDENLLLHAKRYQRLANALYTADEKNMAEEKESLFSGFESRSRDEMIGETLAVILAVGQRFSMDNSRFTDIFGQKFDYLEKMERFTDTRSLKLWLTNYFAWIMDYSASRLRITETDVIVRAKRYLTDHYEDADLSLAKVAEYVELNEKYFSNRFTKETGETFSSYLTALRMQKARELLKTTTFKVYEISEMAGYHNVEHFNRVFKKMNGITPAQYRKTM